MTPCHPSQLYVAQVPWLTSQPPPVLQDLAMLVIGRVMLGWGVGFANQAVPLYLSEIAPPHVRGTLNIMFQMATTIGESPGS